MANFNSVEEGVIKELINIVGEEYVLFDQVAFEKYGRDETEDLIFYPEVVVIPRTKEEIAVILKLCNKEKIPLTQEAQEQG